MKFGLRELIFFVVLLAVPVASFVYVFKPRNDEIRQARQEVDSKLTNLEELEEVTSGIDDLGLEIEKGEQLIKQIEAKLPSEREVEVILEQVWQTAKGQKLTVKSVKSDKPVPAATYMELPLKMVLEGRFDGFYQFLLELENLPRITRIHEMTLARTTEAKGPADPRDKAMKAEFTLSIYFQSRATDTQ